jgi:MOSC domain-containing protein YiiM
MGQAWMRAHLVSVNVGRPQPIERRGRTTFTAIAKSPVAGRVAVRGVNVKGDDQADRGAHGGPDKAVYAYASEDYAWWAQALEFGGAGGLIRPTASPWVPGAGGGAPTGVLGLEPGTFGENLTLAGVDVTGALIGERWAIGSVVLEVTSPRIPCWKLARRVGDPRFIRRFAAARRPGAYLRIVQEGELGAGDGVEIVARPDHVVTVGLFNEAFLHDRSLLGGLLTAEALPADWREWIAERAA